MKMEFERQPDKFYKLLEDYIMETIKSKKYWHLEWIIPGKLDKEGKPVTIQREWFEFYNAGHKINIIDEFKKVHDAADSLDRLYQDLKEAYKLDNIENIKKKEYELLKYSTSSHTRIEKYVKWLTDVGEWDNFLESTKEKWFNEHEKFLEFCAEFMIDTLMPYLREKKEKVIYASIEDIMKEIERRGQIVGGMNIYNPNDMLTGLTYCLSIKNINATVTSDRKYLKFTVVKKNNN